MSDQQSLSATPLFAGLKPDELKQIVALGKPRKFALSELLMKESDKGESVFLLVKGRVDVSVSLPGKDETQVIARLNAGDIVGELTLLGRARRSARVIAKTDVEVIEWEKAALLALFEQQHHIGFRIMQNIAVLLAERLTSMNMVLRNALTVPQTVIL